MPLRLTIRPDTTGPLEVEGIVPDAIAPLSLRDVEQLKVLRGSEKVALAECFRVQGSTSDATIWWEGDLDHVHWLGAGMRTGRMLVPGNAGRHVGSQMRGGTIHVHGHAGDWLGAEMRGGELHVKGSVGDCLGAAYRGSRSGMRGGTILVAGRAGNEVGHSMRRGLIAVAEGVGDLAAMHMRAGTIFSFGPSGERHAMGMIRGTLGFFGEHPRLLPSFRQGPQSELLVLRLLLRDLARRGFAAAHRASCEVRTYHGDMLEGGRGEIWLGNVS